MSDIENWDWMGLLKGSVNAATKGLLDRESSLKRYNACLDCPFLKKNSQCKKCGCFMKAKVRIKASRCPIGKW
jgi:predicted Zn-ribbon and HTH transcriptional regulator